jgi:pyruvate formate lyase activating enzyme
MKEALLYQKLTQQKVRCQTCSHFCLIKPQERGLCGVRENQQGKLYALNYGKIITQHIDPIEKKPLYHFLPGTYSYSIATVGCNLTCKNCQNYDISQGPKPNKPILGQEISPEKIVQEALKNNCPSISYTYTEPTIFLEFALETMKLAHQERLKNIWVTNGFMSAQTLNLIIPYLDAANVDLKSFDDNFYQEYCGARLKPVLNNLKAMKKKNIWLEITTLIIPGLTDQEKILQKIAQFIKKELDPKTPWHISRFFPEVSWQLQNLPTTPLESLEKAYQIGLKAGLKCVHKGNI